ncbi:MjaI family restriction endonuclease [Bhargavaea beijingensis]|uniref:MjaI family restriction endonuclease n=1 Tax=Bhargavaea beijingensis TaxID=426756 RepID=UPI0022249356|nr:MjaI family restriction endonuclease [Bhargavaea beijingensis]MCW1929551.1 MjaI family restriction endonuclease [Bhargavaea beijingensis]
MKSIGKIDTNYISESNEVGKYDYPKYTTQLINLANSNAQGTRPNVVGQMSDLFEEFLSVHELPTVEDWREWYTQQQPNAKNKAKARVLPAIDNLKGAIHQIDENLVEQWIDDVLINKTFNGLYIQKAILQKVSEHFGVPYEIATSAEESKGIDGYIGNTPVSIKPDTYELMKERGENIDVSIIWYKKTTSNRIEVFVEEDLNPDI